MQRPALGKDDKTIRKPLASSLYVGFLLRPFLEESLWLIWSDAFDIDADFSVHRRGDDREIGGVRKIEL